jgi:pyruvate/2-oxoglutarate dehydrogenase complex dihydrolipoamide dehydrogenase (E3) component
VQDIPYWTHREALDCKELPQTLAIIGGGVIGMEFASYFTSLAVKVTVVEMLDEAQFDEVWLVGSEFAFASNRYRVFENVEEEKQTLKTNSIEGQNILIKGSNFTRLYQLPELL